MTDIGVVITAHNQGSLIREAAESAVTQTVPPARIVIVDDGSSDPESLRVLDELAERPRIEVIHQENAGVSAARNHGMRVCQTDLVVVLDGDDRLRPSFVERTSALLAEDPDALGASTWLQMFGVARALVRTDGGDAAAFLGRNRCPATVMLRRAAWAATPGYDESMRGGFEDWDFFLTLLTKGGHIAIVPEPLIEYRTAAASANLTSMNARTELLGHIVDKHMPLYREHVRSVVLDLDATSATHLRSWERLATANPSVPLDEATYGDGGMAAVVRAESVRARSLR